MAMKKVSLTLEEEVVEAARELADGNLSAFVNDVVGREVRKQRARELSDELEREFGPVPEEALEWARGLFRQ